MDLTATYLSQSHQQPFHAVTNDDRNKVQSTRKPQIAISLPNLLRTPYSLLIPRIRFNSASKTKDVKKSEFLGSRSPFAILRSSFITPILNSASFGKYIPLTQAKRDYWLGQSHFHFKVGCTPNSYLVFHLQL